MTGNNGYSASQRFQIHDDLAVTILTDLEYNFFISSMTSGDKVIGNWVHKGVIEQQPDHR